MTKPSARLWDLKELLLTKIREQGGWVNTHNHLDRAYTITPETLHIANATLQEKWDLNDHLKRTSTVDDIYDRMAYAIEDMLKQGVTAIGTFIDVDPVTKDKAMLAATKIRERYGKQVPIKFINQVLKGVIDPEAREWFDRGAEFVDIIGGLPGRDGDKAVEHAEIILDTAKRLNKCVHMHSDQFNDPAETETEMITRLTKKYKMQGKVTVIHGTSISTHPKVYRHKLYSLMVKNGVDLVTCPQAMIDCRRNEVLTPTHNSLAPVEELVSAGVNVALGVDNIADIYKPFVNGDMWTELKVLLESCHYYEIENLVKIATVNGRKVLGLTLGDSHK